MMALLCLIRDIADAYPFHALVFVTCVNACSCVLYVVTTWIR